jgi:hypothetical protein
MRPVQVRHGAFNLEKSDLVKSVNDDKSPLIDLLACIVCKETMKIEKSAPDAEGSDIIQYRCARCGRIERVRLFRRNRVTAILP